MDDDRGEDVAVAVWTAEQFLQLGCTPDQAARLLHAKADWHNLRRLLENGCPLGVAVRILL